MPDPLVTSQDLIDRESSVASMDPSEVASTIADASASIRNFTQQLLTPGESTHRVEIRNGKVRLPQRPIIEVTSVTDLFGNDVTYTVVGEDLDVRTQVADTWSMVPYTTPLREVDVTYEHGYVPMDELIVSIACQVAMRVLTTEVANAGLSDEKLGAYAVGYGTVGASGPSGLFPGEKQALMTFRRPLRSMRVYGS